MRYRSVHSISTDAYRAGAEVAEALQSLSPEVVFLFSSVHYLDDTTGLVAGIRDVLGPDAILCGGTGDGIYETSLVAHQGLAALGVSSGGTVRWATGSGGGIESDTGAAVEKAVASLRSSLGAEPDLVFVLSDGIRTDGCLLVQELRRRLHAPFFGGLAADDRQFERCGLFAGDAAVDDTLLLLGAAGPLPFRLNAASGWRPMGEYGVVESCERNSILRIAGRTAQEFLTEQYGKALGELELGIVALAEYSPDGSETFSLRTASRIHGSSGALTFFGHIKEGTRVRACHASLENVVDGVKQSLSGISAGDFRAGAALLVSCAGRKWILPEQGHEEVKLVLDAFGSDLPLAGFPSFGEIGPYRHKSGVLSEPFFHNVTFVTCLLGE